jgi:hypothetical protein
VELNSDGLRNLAMMLDAMNDAATSTGMRYDAPDAPNGIALTDANEDAATVRVRYDDVADEHRAIFGEG